MAKHKLLKKVKPEHEFILRTGVTIKSLEDLSRILKKMDEEVFSHHVNDTKNDFKNWINDIVKDEQLADTLGSLIKKNEILSAIESRINQLQKKKKNIKLAAKVSKTTIDPEAIVQESKSEKKERGKKHKIEIVKELSKEEWIGNQMTDLAVAVTNKVGELDQTRKEFTAKTHLVSGINDFFLGLVIGLILGLILARVIAL
ncbi:MAG: hypothetical protein QF632_04995 [Candidatus Woesearchaeota archaeon]|jgi:hypothetical protein|nr:hypothetical protein [Candidatus Woesearchaeota archaeon]MDP7324087.1 hypothetical protein [Candidatus Woesearchaeota archaeon]MDP7457996.1 hypothetical protein [Candidatus Woesearchaeota archaeon]